MSASKIGYAGINSEILDFYQVKFKKIWKYILSERLSFWGISLYLFFEYVRPQAIFPALDVAPFGTISLALAIIGVIIDPTVRWVKNSNNLLMTAYFFVILLSAVFAYSSQSSCDYMKIFLNWFLFYYLCINIINTEKRLFLFAIFFFLFSFKMSQNGFITWAQRGFAFSDWGLVGGAGWFKNSGEFAIQMVIFLAMSGAAPVPP